MFAGKGWLFTKIVFSCEILEFQSHSKYKNHFDSPIWVTPHQRFRLKVFAGKGWLFAKIFHARFLGISKPFQAQKPI